MIVELLPINGGLPVTTSTREGDKIDRYTRLIVSTWTLESAVTGRGGSHSPIPSRPSASYRSPAIRRRCGLSNCLEDTRMSHSIFQQPYPTARPARGGHGIPGVGVSRFGVLTYG